MKNESTLQKALSTRVSFVKLDADKDEGKELRDDFPVSGFPTFVLADAKGEYLAHFSGYGDPESFLAELDELLRDPLTLPARRARFEAAPTFTDAKMLARYHEGNGEYERADTYFVSAQGLIADPQDGLEAEIAWMRLRGLQREKIAPDAALAAAEKAVAATHVPPQDKAWLAAECSDAIRGEEHAPRLAALIRSAHDLASAPDAKVSTSALSAVQVARALRVDNDPGRAVELRKASMPEGWEKDGGKLNEFAWWCFENRVNLDEGATLAQKAVELAPKGIDRANALDTLAEIRSVQGRHADAIAAEEQALVEAPENETFRKSLERFRAAASAPPGVTGTN